MAVFKPFSFALALKKALSSESVQDMTAGDLSLNWLTGMRTSVRGKEVLAHGAPGLVPNFSNNELPINSDSPSDFLEQIEIKNPEWFQNTFTGEILPIPNSGLVPLRNFNIVELGKSKCMIALSQRIRKGHLVANEGSMALLINEQITDPYTVAKWRILKYPRVLIIQVDLTEPHNTNNILPNNIMKIGKDQEYHLKSIIQTHKKCDKNGHYSVLSTTHDEDVYLKSYNDEQTNYINVCSDDRLLHEDYIYIYQEVTRQPKLTNITSKDVETHKKDFHPEFLGPQSTLPQDATHYGQSTLQQDSTQCGQSSILIREAIQNAANHGVNLSPGTLSKADGNCIFSAVIGNVNTRECFNSKINLTPPQARELWLNDSHDVVREFAGEDKVDFEIQWNTLKYENIYETKLGDFVMPAIAHTLKYNILIFNTRHMNAHDPIAVVRADQIDGSKAITDIPLVLAYDGTHYEHLIPYSDSDVAKTQKLVNEYTSGTYNPNWDNTPPFSYAQVLKQSTSPASYAHTLKKGTPTPEEFVNSRDIGTPTKGPLKTPTKGQLGTHNEVTNLDNKQCPNRVSKGRKHVTLHASPNHHCMLNLNNRFNLL